jgi:hypothetical protein
MPALGAAASLTIHALTLAGVPFNARTRCMRRPEPLALSISIAVAIRTERLRDMKG